MGVHRGGEAGPIVGEGKAGMTTRSRVLALVGTMHYPTLRAVAEDVGVSVEWVRQILRTAGRTEYCIEAHSAHRRAVMVCPDCGGIKTSYARRCMACCHRVPPPSLMLTCETCGRQFQRRQYMVMQALKAGYRHVWCSKSCQGRSWSKYRSPRQKPAGMTQ